MGISREQAIALAKNVARHQRWEWTGEIQATLRKPIPVLGWLFGRHPVWRVVSNADDVGYNVMVTIDAETRDVLKQRFGSR
jgi:hypothetical protein